MASIVGWGHVRMVDFVSAVGNEMLLWRWKDLVLLKHALSSLFHLRAVDGKQTDSPGPFLCLIPSYYPLAYLPSYLCVHLFIVLFCLISVYNPLILNSDCFCSIPSPSRAQLSTRQLCLSTLNISRTDLRATVHHPSSERCFWIFFFLLWSPLNLTQYFGQDVVQLLRAAGRWSYWGGGSRTGWRPGRHERFQRPKTDQ